MITHRLHISISSSNSIHAFTDADLGWMSDRMGAQRGKG
jgi:hypothetical protein